MRLHIAPISCFTLLSFRLNGFDHEFQYLDVDESPLWSSLLWVPLLSIYITDFLMCYAKGHGSTSRFFLLGAGPPGDSLFLRWNWWSMHFFSNRWDSALCHNKLDKDCWERCSECQRKRKRGTLLKEWNPSSAKAKQREYCPKRRSFIGGRSIRSYGLFPETTWSFALPLLAPLSTLLVKH